MIDHFRARAAHAAVERPVIVEDKQVGGFRAPLGLVRPDLLASILDHLAIGRNALGRVHTPAVNFGLRRLKAKSTVAGSIAGATPEPFLDLTIGRNLAPPHKILSLSPYHIEGQFLILGFESSGGRGR